MVVAEAPVRRASRVGPVRAVAYLRVSTDLQAERGYGLEVQRGVLEAFSGREHLTLVKAYVDPGVPGSTPLEEREGLRSALAFVRSGKADVLLVARYDRLARDTLQALLIEQAFRQAGAGVLYCEGANGDEPIMELQREMMHALAKFQKQELVARLMAAKAAKAAAGGYAGGRPPFGYQGRDGALAPKPSEAAVVKWIYAEVLAGRTTRQITSMLDQERTLGRRWTQNTICRVLSNRIYKTGAPANRIVDPKIWNRVRKVLSQRRK